MKYLIVENGGKLVLELQAAPNHHEEAAWMRTDIAELDCLIRAAEERALDVLVLKDAIGGPVVQLALQRKESSDG